MRPEKKPEPVAAGSDEIKNQSCELNSPQRSQHFRNNLPVALAREFGCIFAVYVRDLDVESRVSLHSDTGTAADAAATLNSIFRDEAP